MHTMAPTTTQNAKIINQAAEKWKMVNCQIYIVSWIKSEETDGVCSAVTWTY